MKTYDWKGGAWSSATLDERDLFMIGLNRALIQRNKQKYGEGVKEARKAALQKDIAALKLERDAEHGMTDHLA